MAVKDTRPPSRSERRQKNVEPLTSDAYKDEKPSPFSIDGIRSNAVHSGLFKGLIVISGLIMAGTFIASSLNPTGTGGRNPNVPNAPTNATVASLGNQTISGIQLANTFGQQQRFNEQFGQKTGVTDYLRSKQQALQGLTDNAATVIAAQNARISVSDADIDKEIDKEIGEALKPQQGMTEAANRRRIESEYGSLQAAKDKMRGNVTSEVRTQISNKLLVDKLEKQIKDDNKVTEDDYKRSVTKLKLWQIVLRPKFPAPGAKDAKAETDKNNLDAQTRAAKLFGQLKATPTLANFKTTAQKSSEDVATKAKGGDFGWKLPAEIYYDPSIGETLSKTSGNLAGPFKDASGNQYIFFIENRKTELPKDYAKNKKKLIADFETQQDNAAWQKKQDEYKKAQTPEISDNALSAYQIQTTDIPAASGDEQKKLRADAISRYQDGLGGAGGIEAAAINYQLSQLYRDDNDHPKQLATLDAAVKDYPNDPSLRLEYARALREGGKPKDALVQVKAASTALAAAPMAPSPFGGYNPGDAIHQQIASEFDTLKEPKLAAEERAKVKPAAPGAGGMGGMPPGIQMMPGR